MKYLFEKFHKIQKKKSLPASHFCYSCRPTANNFSFSCKFFSFSWKSCWFFQSNFFYGTPIRCCFPTIQWFNFTISKLYVIIISRSRWVWIYTQYLKGIKFRGYLVSWFRDFWPFSGNFVPAKSFKTKISRNCIPAEFEILFWLIYDQSMMMIPVYCISLLMVTKLDFL